MLSPNVRKHSKEVLLDIFSGRFKRLKIDGTPHSTRAAMIMPGKDKHHGCRLRIVASNCAFQTVGIFVILLEPARRSKKHIYYHMSLLLDWLIGYYLKRGCFTPILGSISCANKTSVIMLCPNLVSSCRI